MPPGELWSLGGLTRDRRPHSVRIPGLHPSGKLLQASPQNRDIPELPESEPLADLSSAKLGVEGGMGRPFQFKLVDAAPPNPPLPPSNLPREHGFPACELSRAAAGQKVRPRLLRWGTCVLIIGS